MVTKLSERRICLMGGRVFLECMSLTITCLMRAYVLMEGICRRKCLVGGHEDTF